MPARRRALQLFGAIALAGDTLALGSLAKPYRADAADADVRASARDGYVFGYPLVLMMVTKAIATAAAGGAWVHMLSGPTPPFRIVVAPNGDTRYSSLWADLSAEPQVLHVPDAGGRYFVAQVMDAWTDVLADPTTRIAGSSPADYALIGPRWNGTLPAGLRAVRSSTDDVWILARTRARSDDSPDAITAIQRGYRIVPLSRYGEAAFQPPPPILRDPNTPTGPTPPSLVASMGSTSVLRHARDRAAAQPAAPGRRADRRTPASGGADAARAQRTVRVHRLAGRRCRYRRRTSAHRLLRSAERRARQRLALDARHGPLRHELPLPRDDRAHAARGEPSRKTRSIPKRASTPKASASRANAGMRCTSPRTRCRRRTRSGRSRCTAPAGYLVENPINRYTLRDAALRRNADGSIDVAIAHDAPSGDTTNWLPAPPGPFVVMLRMYWPRQAGIDGTYAIPPLEPR